MPDPATGIPGKTAETERLRSVVASFQSAWERDGAAEVNAFLPPATDSLYRAALLELVRADLQLRWSRGRGVFLEGYLKQYPELGNSTTISPLLILEEHEARKRFGSMPDL